MGFQIENYSVVGEAALKLLSIVHLKSPKRVQVVGSGKRGFSIQERG